MPELISLSFQVDGCTRERKCGSTGPHGFHNLEIEIFSNLEKFINVSCFYK